ncbi:MAG TPA: CHASE3 domain-containing protein [Candidatus Sulfotelmatobacter sp.]|jgi:PAS domain S-box-containing protein|nr:CHASE3 domain-containing protein [Candidatus Sulfotelmatobacter sp.]
MSEMFHKTLQSRWLREFPRIAGAAVASFGLLIVVSWFAHWQPVVQMLPDTAPMKFNTALCFICLGTALILLTTRLAYYAPWLGGAVLLFTGLTLVEYLLQRDLNIDQLFFKSYIQADTMYLGRMSPLAVVCFILVSLGVIIVGPQPRWPRRFSVVGICGCIVAVIALVALFGFAFGIQSAYGWGSYSRMAVNTAAVFLVLSGGLLVHAWQTAREENFYFARWLPVTAALTLLAMIAFISVVNLEELDSATYWRKHTVDVILDAQAFQDNVTALQLGMRGYVTQRDTNALASYQGSLQREPEQFDQLVELTGDNPAQQNELKALAAAMDVIFAFDRRLLAVYEQEGFAGVSRIDATGESRRVFGSVIDEIKKFSAAEQKLLSVRGAVEQADSDKGTRLMVVGSVLAALLLVFANQMASRELLYRQRAEAKLSQALILQDAILNSADYGIVSTDPKGIVQSFNHAAELMLGYSAKEVVGKATPMLWRDPLEITEMAQKLSKNIGQPVKPNFEAAAMKVQFNPGQIDEGEYTFIRKDGSRFTCLLVVTMVSDNIGFRGYMGVFRDVSQRKQQEAGREKLIADLQAALTQVKTLSGTIPICGWCKSVRSDEDGWQGVEQYVRARLDVTFSHGICPTCTEKVKADIEKLNKRT